MRQMKIYMSMLAAIMVALFAGCSDDKESAPLEQYGYVQFKVLKEASYADSRVSGTLDKLADANKMTVLMQYEGYTISPTVRLRAYNDENAEYGLLSDKVELLAGEYTIIGYYLYDRNDQPIATGTLADNNLSVEMNGITIKDVPVDVTPRGTASFRLVKDIVKTRAAEYDAYPFSNIKLVDISLTNTFTKEITSIKGIPVKYTRGFKDGSDDELLYPEQNAETSYGVCDTLVWLNAGTYKVSSYTTYSDKKGKNILEVASVDSDVTFTIEDNLETRDIEVPVRLAESDENIKDYIALRQLWEALDGPNWSYAGQEAAEGSNWNFNKDIDMWGEQPGVQLHSNGRVATISIAGMGAKGKVPDAIGQLTELVIFSIGSHSDLIGGHLFDNISPEMSEEQKMAMRYHYEQAFLEKDFRLGLSKDWIRTIEADATAQPIVKKGIELKHIQFGDLTNGITGISKAMMRLINLQQFYIANSPITYEGFFTDIEPSSPYYEQCDTLKWGNLQSLTDLEIYNCPNLTALPMEMLTELPELQQLNVACNKGISGEQLKADWEALINGACGSKIQILYMGYNNLVETPEYTELKKMTKLGMLDVASNKIEKIHPFGKDIQLAKIYLDNNNIKEIPCAEDGYFCGYTQLESFTCSHNKLQLFPDIFNANSVYVIPSIDFSYNEITDFENGDASRGVNVNQVNLSNNRLATFPSVLFKKNSPITYLVLAGNGMKEIPDGSMKGENAYMLEALDLSYNKLTRLSDDFYAVRLPYLTGIDLSYNCFNRFPTAPLSISSLQRYIIRHQRDEEGNRTLREWPTGLYRCPSLAFFLIGSNDLRKIEDTLSPYIYYFEIADNPNISIDMTSLCPYIEAGAYMLIYDKTQDIRGCEALGIEN